MKKMLAVVLSLCVMMLIGSMAFAEEKGPVETVLDG
jgi:hypothetical protein